MLVLGKIMVLKEWKFNYKIIRYFHIISQNVYILCNKYLKFVDCVFIIIVCKMLRKTFS